MLASQAEKIIDVSKHSNMIMWNLVLQIVFDLNNLGI